ncbi:MAG TPA: hypothetical protein VHB02_03755 [Acidimicrobiales bacterium]|nr:hypothetical protein [Acidimicrobiales bacterium]
MFISFVVYGELASPEPREVAGHLGEDRRIEAAIFLGRQFHEVIEAVAGFHCHEVDKVAGFCPAEDRQELIDG